MKVTKVKKGLEMSAAGLLIGCIAVILTVSVVVVAQTNYLKYETCNECKGTGKNICKRCGGKGCFNCKMSGFVESDCHQWVGGFGMIECITVIHGAKKGSFLPGGRGLVDVLTNPLACCACMGKGKIAVDTRFIGWKKTLLCESQIAWEDEDGKTIVKTYEDGEGIDGKTTLNEIDMSFLGRIKYESKDGKTVVTKFLGGKIITEEELRKEEEDKKAVLDSAMAAVAEGKARKKADEAAAREERVKKISEMSTLELYDLMEMVYRKPVPSDGLRNIAKVAKVVLSKSENDALSLYLIGKERDSKRIREAITILDNLRDISNVVLSKRENDALALYLRSDKNKDRESRREAALQIFSDTYKNNAKVLWLIGNIHYKRGSDLLAMKCYKSALEIEPDYEPAQMGLAAVAIKLGDAKTVKKFIKSKDAKKYLNEYIGRGDDYSKYETYAREVTVGSGWEQGLKPDDAQALRLWYNSGETLKEYFLK